MTTPAVRMPVPTDPKAPKFDGDDRNLLSFLEDYESAADAAKLTEGQKIHRLVRYVPSDVRDDIEQYEEYQVDRNNATAGSWGKLVARLEKEYPIAKKARLFTLSEYEAWIAVNRDREISSELDLGKFTRELKRYSGSLIKRGILSQAAVAKHYADILEQSLGQNLALGLSIARRTAAPPAAGQTAISPDDAYTLDEVFEEAQRIVRSGTLGVGVVFKAAPIAVPAFPTQIVHPVQVKTEETLLQQLLTKISTLEQQQKQLQQGRAPNTNANPGASSGANTSGAADAGGANRAQRMSSGCYYCGGAHSINACENMKNDLAKGRCRQQNGRVVYPDGSEIRMDGRRLGERITEFNKAHPDYEKMHAKKTGGSVAAMLVEVGNASFAGALASAPAVAAEPQNTNDPEQNWWAFMANQFQSYAAREAEKKRTESTRTGLRSQNADKPKEDAPPAPPPKDTFKRDAPPHEGKEPVQKPPAGPSYRASTPAAQLGLEPTRVVEGTPRAPPPFGTAQPARPQFRVQAPLEDEGLAKVVAERVLKTEVPMSMAEIAALCPSVRRFLRDQVTPKRVTFAGYTGMSDESSSDAAETVDVWRYKMIEDQGSVSRDLITAQPALPLRYLDCRLGSFDVEGVLDGGAQVVIVSKRLWLELGLGLDSARAVTLEAANSTTNKTEGVLADLPIAVGGLTFHVQAHVIDDAPFDLLLGRPFYSITSAEEKHELDGTSTIVLHDSNQGLATRLPTRARLPARTAVVPNSHF